MKFFEFLFTIFFGDLFIRPLGKSIRRLAFKFFKEQDNLKKMENDDSEQAYYNGCVGVIASMLLVGLVVWLASY
jgi:hypothetical protein